MSSPSAPGPGLDDPRAVPGEDLVKCGRELAVAVADQELDAARALAEVHEQVTSLLGGPGPGRVDGDTQDMHGPGLDLHHEQDVHAPEQDGVDVQEITCQDAGRLGGQELPPRW
jgi:hypothetical protein